MLIDAFTYFNETEMLLFRLRMLSPLVDKFLIVECDHTFSGRPKPYYSDDLDSRFDEFLGKIIFYKKKANINGLDFSSKPETFDQSADCWQIEKQQRDGISYFFKCSDIPLDSTVLMGDVDEIPSREAIEYAIEHLVYNATPIPFGMFNFYHNLKFLRDAKVISQDPPKMEAVMWGATVITDVKTLIEKGAENIRRERKDCPYTITQGGWHLSYFGDVKNKIESFSHQEYNKEEFTNEAHIKECMETGKDLFDRGTPVVPVAKEFFPKYFRNSAPAEWWGF